MRDAELYRHLLGIESPWTVGAVELSAEERVWRHLDSCQFLTYLHARPPASSVRRTGSGKCSCPGPRHAPSSPRFSNGWRLTFLREADIRGASRILRISWDEAWHIVERVVVRGQRSNPVRVSAYVGVDEKAIAKGQQYLTLV